MSTFYFSGIEKKATAEALGRAGAAGMMSRLEYSDNLMTVCNAHNLKLVMDCGSFTKPLSRDDIQQYAHLIIKLDTRCEWYANPDKIGDQAQSNANYVYLLSLLPEHLRSRILWIYQYGSDIEYLLQGLAQHTLVGIGGLVPLIQSDRVKALHVIVGLAQLVREHNASAHFFGISTPSIIEALHTIFPDFSVDSTTWLVGARYGRLINKRGQQHSASELGYDFDSDSILSQNIKTMRRWVEIAEKAHVDGERFIQRSLFGSAS